MDCNEVVCCKLVKDWFHSRVGCNVVNLNVFYLLGSSSSSRRGTAADQHRGQNSNSSKFVHHTSTPNSQYAFADERTQMRRSMQSFCFLLVRIGEDISTYTGWRTIGYHRSMKVVFVIVIGLLLAWFVIYASLRSWQSVSTACGQQINRNSLAWKQIGQKRNNFHWPRCGLLQN